MKVAGKGGGVVVVVVVWSAAPTLRSGAAALDEKNRGGRGRAQQLAGERGALRPPLLSSWRVDCGGLLSFMCCVCVVCGLVWVVPVAQARQVSTVPPCLSLSLSLSLALLAHRSIDQKNQ